MSHSRQHNDQQLTEIYPYAEFERTARALTQKVEFNQHHHLSHHIHSQVQAVEP